MRLIDADKFLKEILAAGIGKTIIEYSESDIKEFEDNDADAVTMFDLLGVSV